MPHAAVAETIHAGTGRPVTEPHNHTPGAALHDDHTCPNVRCSTCGKAGRVDNGTWHEVDAQRQT